MSKFSSEMYAKIFDSLLSAELHFSSSYASEANIQLAIKRVLGNSVKNGHILLYSDLFVDAELNVHFTIKDPDSDIIKINLIYGE